MSKRTEYELQIAVGGKVDSSLTKSVNEIKGELGSMGSTIKTVVAAAATAFTSIKLKEAFDDVTDASKEMETSMAGVAKVVDGLKDSNGKVTKSYYEMKDAIMDMSTELPMTSENIAAIMEAAGQSHIAKSELLDFTETATKMGIAFDSTAEQAGDWMAAWRTALGMNQEQVTTLADQINYLGNTGTENAVKISEVITRVGSLSKTANVSAASVAAMAASMTKVESDVAATGIKNFTLALVAGDSATKRQISAYKKLGLEAGAVAKNMQVDSEGTMIDVLERVNKLSKEEQTSTLKNLFGSESLSSIAPLAANLENLKEQFHKVGDASLYAGSMEKEYISASSTAANVDILSANKVEKMKVQIGDTLVSLSTLAAETKGNLAESIGDFVQEHGPEIENTVRNIEESFEKFLPTAVRELKEFGNGAMDFIEPVYNLIEENPKLLPDFIVSTGAAMVTYKVGKNIGAIAKNAKIAGSPIKLLASVITNPWALAIGATAGAIAMIATSVYNAKKELREADLASRFGDITLSLEDLDEIAGEIIASDNLGKLSESLKSTDTINDLKNSLDDTMEELKKFNWKISIGLELTDDEKAAYQAAITNFISDSQNLLLEDRYKLNINMELFTDGTLEGKIIREKMNTFYNNNYEKLNNLGTELQKAVNDAFSDGLLTIDESKVISDYMQQMADLNKQIADAKFDAKMTALGTEYTGTGLTADSFKNLQSEVNEQVSETKQGYTDALASQLQSYKVAYSQGGLSSDEYQKATDMAKQGYLDQVSELESKAFNFQYKTIVGSYSDILQKAIPEFNTMLTDEVTSSMEEVKTDGLWGKAMISLYDGIMDFDGVDETAKANLKSLFKELQPSQESMEDLRQKYVEAGVEVPQWLSEGLQNSATLGALAGDADSLAKTVGMQIANSPEYTNMTKEAYNQGVNLDKELIEGIEYKKPDIQLTVGGILTDIKETLEEGVDVEIPAKITLKNGKPDLSNVPQTRLYSSLFGKLQHNAKGNIVTKPIVTTFAEEGPEAAIPLDGSQRAVELWYMAGQIMGLINRDSSYGQPYSIPSAYQTLAGSTTNNNVNNQPYIKNEYNINVESGADVKKVQQAITITQAQFNKMMSAYNKDKGRVSMNQ